MLLDRPTYSLRKRFFTFVGAKVEVYDSDGHELMFVQQKGLKLREDVRVYADELRDEELMLIQARQIIDVSAMYDVFDGTTEEHVGVLQRRGLKSLVRDTWEILDPDEAPIADLHEDHQLLALVRRFITDMVPQSFSVYMNDEEVCRIQQNFNPFIRKLRIYFRAGGPPPIDPRLLLAAAILILLIEGRQ